MIDARTLYRVAALVAIVCSAAAAQPVAKTFVASQPDPSAAPAAATSQPERVKAWFLTLASTQYLYNTIQRGGDNLPDLVKLTAASESVIERDEMTLLAAILDIQRGKPSAARFAAMGKTTSPKVALAARRYAVLLKLYPTGKADGESLVDYATFGRLCRQTAGDALTRGEGLLKEVDGMGVLSPTDWEKAWAKFQEARQPFEQAAVLDDAIPPSRLAALKATQKKLADIGVRVTVAKADRQKEDIRKDLDDLRQSGAGRWGPPLTVKKINDQIDALAATKRQMQSVLEAYADDPAGRDPSLRRQADEIDCLKLLKTTDGERQFRSLLQLFSEAKPVAMPGKPADYRLVRLEKILK